MSIQLGDRVAYSGRFLHNTGQFTGLAPTLRGTVILVEPLGDMSLISVEWDDDHGTWKVLEKNLAVLGTRDMYCD